MSISQPPFSYTLDDQHSEQNLAGALRGAYIRLGTYSNLYLNTVCLDSFWQMPCVLCVTEGTMHIPARSESTRFAHRLM